MVLSIRSYNGNIVFMRINRTTYTFTIIGMYNTGRKEAIVTDKIHSESGKRLGQRLECRSLFRLPIGTIPVCVRPSVT